VDHEKIVVCLNSHMLYSAAIAAIKQH